MPQDTKPVMLLQDIVKWKLYYTGAEVEAEQCQIIKAIN